MDVICVVFINLFIVPLICVAISASRNGKKIKWSAEWFVRYGCYTSILVPLAKIAASLLEKAIGQPVELYSGYYTLGAVVLAALLPYVAEVLRKMFNVKCYIEKNEEKE